MTKVSTLNVGIGLAGTRVAAGMAHADAKMHKVDDGSENEIYPGEAKLVLFNTSAGELLSMNNVIDDMEGIKPSISKVIGTSGTGAGMNRTNSLRKFKEEFSADEVLGNLITLVDGMLSGDDEVLLYINVSFSTGGGTGSGVGPTLYRILHSIFAAYDNVNVIGVALLPSFDEGIVVFSNTILALYDIDNIIENDGGKFILLEHQDDATTAGNILERRGDLNDFISILMVRYRIPSNHHAGVVDDGDRWAAWNRPGLHSLGYINKQTIEPSKCLGPDSTMSELLLAEIPEAHVEFVENSFTGNYIDFKFGFTHVDHGIYGYHGFNSIQSLSINYRNRYDELKAIKEVGDTNNGNKRNAFADIGSQISAYGVNAPKTKAGDTKVDISGLIGSINLSIDYN